MVAASSPVVLWAPSSVEISSTRCRLGPREFVKYVEAGKVRIIGRENWIMSRHFRNNYRWAGAHWVSEIDDAVKSIATNDELLPLNERRVALAEDERGDVWAERHLAENPQLVDAIYGALSAPDALDHFPFGVIKTAMSASDEPRNIVLRVVRDAYNHDAAIAQSGTRTPFLLARKEARFHQLLESVRQASDVAFLENLDSPALKSTELAELTAEVLHVLRHLEASHRTKISSFLRSEGHVLLAKWMSQVCSSLSRGGAGSTRGEVIARLRQEFDAGKLENDFADIFLEPQSVVGSIGTAAGVAEAVSAELTVYGAIGLATGAYAVGQGVAQKLGYAATEYDGPQWAFIYAFGRRASARRQARLQMTLDCLVPE